MISDRGCLCGFNKSFHLDGYQENELEITGTLLYGLLWKHPEGSVQSKSPAGGLCSPMLWALRLPLVISAAL